MYSRPSTLLYDVLAGWIPASDAASWVTKSSLTWWLNGEGGAGRPSAPLERDPATVGLEVDTPESRPRAALCANAGS